MRVHGRVHENGVRQRHPRLAVSGHLSSRLAANMVVPLVLGGHGDRRSCQLVLGDAAMPELGQSRRLSASICLEGICPRLMGIG